MYHHFGLVLRARFLSFGGVGRVVLLESVGGGWGEGGREWGVTYPGFGE